MCKKVLLIVFLTIFTVSLRAQFASSGFIPVKQGIWGSLWTPNVAISTFDNEVFLLNLILTDPNDYSSIPQDGRLAIKFSSGEVVTLHHTVHEQVKSFNSSYIGGTLVNEYSTIDCYTIDDIESFNKNVITKIRIELENQDFKDIEIDGSYQYKFHDKLLDAFKECQNDFEKRRSIKDNFEEGF